ncbi:HAMP domain-containing histidine kinase [Maribacter algarum]|uniref:histidine kinase n=1 Tax=Maribacter algarum (ex Zhang et al. 2020) TaxID=2578118 RepID=A0A5S3PV55_9FLAO|nr:HAMP domain-containing sensor histidine kinase [Maribacter algarum]TMM58830.1 HAMP domain-containing histidine kinase [Maribacter algarum]
MKKRINILIVTAIITLLALTSIQVYLIYNTYELKKKAFLNETSDAIGRLDDEAELVVETAEIWGQEFVELLWEYRFENLGRDEFLNELRTERDSLSKAFNKLYQNEVRKSNLGYDVQFKKNIYSIIILDSVANDTVFAFNEENPIFVLGENFKDEEGYRVSQARWQTDYTQIDDQGVARTFEFLVTTRDQMSISEWKRIVLGRMAGLLIASVLVFLFVTGLFYYSIKNLIKQKKVADVKSDFINNITHELKTPLATLSLASKSLRQKEILQSPAIFENTLGIIDRQNSRLQKLIDQVMTNSLGSEDFVLNKEQVIDDDYFRNIIEDFSLSVQSQDLTIQKYIEPKEVVLRIDSFLFTTALFNILENAVKYGKESIEIKINTRLRNNHYEIEIQDNGIGISNKHQKEVFEKFYRVASGNVHNVKGLGLGLYYTRQVIDAHDGSISLMSEVNKGTSFIINIPVS